MITKFQKVGNSLAVYISKDIVKKLQVREGTPAEVLIHGNKISIAPHQKLKKPKYDIRELCAQITPENRHPEIDWGPDVGKEIVEY